MSDRHPIISITGSSGAGTSTAKRAFEAMCAREGVKLAVVEGDAFHRYDRVEMKAQMAKAAERGDNHFSHFGPDANLFGELEKLFRSYGETGVGRVRKYLHDETEAAPYAHLELRPGEFTPWEDTPADSDMLFYEGLHGALVTDDVDIAQHVDLKIGVVPVVNLEWIQKIHRDTSDRGYSEESVVATILRRMPDYVNYIVPQFQHTDINVQRVPVVDTSDPFIARDIPTADESLSVIRLERIARFDVDFLYLLAMIERSFMSRRNTIVVPAGKTQMAMELLIAPILSSIIENRGEV